MVLVARVLVFGLAFVVLGYSAIERFRMRHLSRLTRRRA